VALKACYLKRTFKNAGWGTVSGGGSGADGGAAESRYYMPAAM
jgi:hypothetical protein